MRLAERCGVNWRAFEETGASRHRTGRGRAMEVGEEIDVLFVPAQTGSPAGPRTR